MSARDMAVPLGRRRDVEVLLRQGEQNDWMPEPDVVPVPSEAAMQGLVAEQIKKMNGGASPGFDCVAPLFIKYAIVVHSWANGRGTERENVLVPCVGSFLCCYMTRPAYPRWLLA